MGLPTWADVIWFGWAPFLLLDLITLPASRFPEFSFVISNSLAFVVALFTFLTMRFLRREITGLMEYVRGLNNGSNETAIQLDLSGFSSTRRVILVYGVLLVFTVPLFAFGQASTPIIVNLVSEVPFLWFNFLLATFFWTFGYSMYSISKIGKLPLMLRPYTEDRTLGLRPFGKASLNFTLIYVGVVSTIVIPVIIGGAIPVGIALGFLVLYPVGFLFFLVPLFGLHSKLVNAKAKELAWIGPRFTVLLEKVKTTKGDRLDQTTVNEVSVLDKIRRDAQQIHTWPFDTGIMARLAAIVISVVAVLLSAIVRDLLRF